MKRIKIAFSGTVAFVILIVFFASANAETIASKTQPPTIKLTENGKSLLPLVVSENASDRIKDTANTLAEYIGLMNGAKFEFKTAPAPLGGEGKGIFLGLASEFENATDLDTKDPTRIEDYKLRSTKNGLELIGTTELAVQNAMWDLMYRLGYRQFFPGEKWEIIPHNPDLSIAIDIHEHPDYLSRRIWYGFGTTKPESDQFYIDWWQKNRVATAIDLNNSHEYASIILRNKAEFNAHPEYYSLIKGQRAVWDGAQFCISNPNLRKLVVADALRKLEQNPKLDSVSVEPNDGGGWCECPECAKVGNGSVSDRVVSLANEVAAAVSAKYPGKFVGVLAYNEHSPPPSIRVHPSVVVSIATAFIRGGYTIDQLIDGWSSQCDIIGIYDYYSFFTWDWDNPGAARAGSTEYMRKTSLEYFQKGARFMNAESSNNWGPNGLGYYLASRFLWDTSQALRSEEIIADFLEKCFGEAKEPMGRWYGIIDGKNKPLMSNDIVGKMYIELDKALKVAKNPAVRARIYDLVLYTRWVEMVNATQRLAEPQKELLMYSWRIHETNMMHTQGHWSIGSAGIPEEANYGVPEPKNPWKNSKPYTPEEMDKMVSNGIAANPTVHFKTVNYSRDLVPATPLNLQSPVVGDFGFFRDKAQVFTWVDKAPASIKFKAQSGVSTGAVEGDAHIVLYNAGEPEAGGISEFPIPRDNANVNDIEMRTDRQGLHAVSIDDGSAGTRVTWPEGIPMVLESGARAQHNFNGKWSMWAYVPKGTKYLGGYRFGLLKGKIVGPDGNVKLAFTGDTKTELNRDYWEIPVPAGMDGKLWLFQDVEGAGLRVLSIPPYFARRAEELLLPREVVEADKK